MCHEVPWENSWSEKTLFFLFLHLESPHFCSHQVKVLWYFISSLETNGIDTESFQPCILISDLFFSYFYHFMWWFGQYCKHCCVCFLFPWVLYRVHFSCGSLFQLLSFTSEITINVSSGFRLELYTVSTL